MTRWRRIVILTGAGISKESGLDTFRDRDGVWARVALEDVATPEAFARDPARVHEFYNARRQRLLGAGIRPNAAHIALAELEWRSGAEVLLVTQNVDNLHERAGSRNLVHMHGELLKARCGLCSYDAEWRDALSVATPCPACARTGAMRPDVVWFGEPIREHERIEAALARCDLFLAVGTSGAVYPAAGFVERARPHAHTVELNLAASEIGGRFAETDYGPASAVVPRFVNRILERAA